MAARRLVSRSADGGGADVVSRMLAAIAQFLPRTAGDENRSATRLFAAATELWRAALDLPLPATCRHLAGAGRLADARALDDGMWLELTARTVELDPAVDHPDAVARRAAETPTPKPRCAS
ncbi:hypothetical protein ACFVUN_23160 [Kitasatospora griseola]|uniref:hypothetical protein n=1 Tax=Kitasatospora griseola TaxID=2064 RepID=UPI0036DCC6B1